MRARYNSALELISTIIHAEYTSIRHLMKKLHMTAAEAMNLLEVPLSEQEKYASQL